jgi:hypothetical protein
MRKTETKQLIRMMQREFDEEKRLDFVSLGDGGHYTRSQKDYAFKVIDESGVRATARILRIPRRTLQRWCREYGKYVKRCPFWVYEWVKRRRKRWEFWARRGYS